MSYVPATFTAGFALMLTAAGAVGGQWVAEVRQSLDERPPETVVARVDRASAPSATRRDREPLGTALSAASRVAPAFTRPEATLTPPKIDEKPDGRSVPEAIIKVPIARAYPTDAAKAAESHNSKVRTTDSVTNIHSSEPPAAVRKREATKMSARPSSTPASASTPTATAAKAGDEGSAALRATDLKTPDALDR
jgi:hypothetical protein